MPSKFTGLCNGANGIKDSIVASTVSSIIVGWKYLVPPCTTLCPTPKILIFFLISSSCSSDTQSMCRPLLTIKYYFKFFKIMNYYL